MDIVTVISLFFALASLIIGCLLEDYQVEQGEKDY